MAPQHTASKHSKAAACTALFLLGAWHTGPVLAASNHDILCDNSHRATLEIAEYELTPRQVSHEAATTDLPELASRKDEMLSKDHLLKPRVEATVREIFADPEESSPAEEESIDAADKAAVRELDSPRMTDGHAAPLKRKMYRRDI